MVDLVSLLVVGLQDMLGRENDWGFAELKNHNLFEECFRL